MNPYYFAQTTTYDATPAAGASAECVPNVKRFWDTLFEIAQGEEDGKLKLYTLFNFSQDWN